MSRIPSFPHYQCKKYKYKMEWVQNQFLSFTSATFETSCSPNATLTLDKLAWILSTSADASLRNGKEAILLAERACQITQNTNPITLATLSAAYAEDGQFEKAIVVAQRSQTLTDAVKAPKLFELLKRQIDSYTARRPFRNG